MNWPLAPLGEVLKHRKQFIHIDDMVSYKRCRVQLHAQGVVLRDVVTGAEIKTKKQQVCRPGEFLVAEIDAKLGGYGIVPEALEGAVVSSHYFLFGVDESRLNLAFLGYYIRTPAFAEQVAAQGSTNYAAIRPGHVLEYTIPLPPVEEQRRIVARVDAIATRVTEARRLREESIALGSALFRSELAQRLTFADYRGRLGDVLTCSPRNGWSARCDGFDTGTPVLSLSAVTGFRYRATEFKRTSEATRHDAEYWLRLGDLLITRSNTPDLVGHAAIYDGTPSPCIYPDLMMRLEVDSERVDPHFLLLWLQGREARQHIRQNAKGTSPSMKKISQGTVSSIPFPTGLPLTEQRRIVAHLDALQAKLAAVRAEQAATAAELDALLPSVLNRAFAGEL